MPTVFSRIIDGDLPGRFVWSDDISVAFLSINPIRPGHVLVVPRAEVDRWTDLDPATASHLMGVAQQVARAQQEAFRPVRVGMIIAGLEVPHVHLHLIPIDSEADLDFRLAERSPDPAALDAAAAAIRDALRGMGATGVADSPS
ncbi:MAG: HIT family protein [Acidimicrobiia bacterium]|nr:HIT family protein [Acidimicrobiia bacterium]